MRFLKKMWSALETIPDAATDRLEWKRILEDEWPVAARHLRSTGRLVEQVRCPSPGGAGCPRRVVHHAGGQIVAVCGDRPKQCDPLDLDLEDLVVLEVDWGKLESALARIFDVDATTAAKLTHGVHRLGEHVVVAGTGFPVVLLIPEEFHASPHATLPAALNGLGLVVLLTPTRKLLGDAVLDALAARGDLIVPLIEMVGANKAGCLATLRPAAELLGVVRDRLIQQRKIKGPEYRFPTPLGTRWHHVSIRFLNGHDVHIQARGQSAVYDFTQMGMADSRKNPAEPNLQWKLLIQFAENGGEFTWRNHAANPKKQKTKELLARALRTFFGIDGEPFENLPNGFGWRARFRVVPEA
jgi:hypothetical protein